MGLTWGKRKSCNRHKACRSLKQKLDAVETSISQMPSSLKGYPTRARTCSREFLKYGQTVTKMLLRSKAPQIPNPSHWESGDWESKLKDLFKMPRMSRGQRNVPQETHSLLSLLWDNWRETFQWQREEDLRCSLYLR